MLANVSLRAPAGSGSGAEEQNYLFAYLLDQVSLQLNRPVTRRAAVRLIIYNTLAM